MRVALAPRLLDPQPWRGAARRAVQGGALQQRAPDSSVAVWYARGSKGADLRGGRSQAAAPGAHLRLGAPRRGAAPAAKGLGALSSAAGAPPGLEASVRQAAVVPTGVRPEHGVPFFGQRVEHQGVVFVFTRHSFLPVPVS